MAMGHAHREMTRIMTRDTVLGIVRDLDRASAYLPEIAMAAPSDAVIASLVDIARGRIDLARAAILRAAIGDVEVSET